MGGAAEEVDLRLEEEQEGKRLLAATERIDVDDPRAGESMAVNTAVGPAAGVVDRVRDAVRGAMR